MSPLPLNRERESRIGSAVNSLVRQLIPAFPGEDEISVEDRRDTAHELAMSILQSGIAPAVVADVNHAGDLIKKKLIRNNSSPEKALRFSNLYSRLISQPLLSQKWAILYLLYQLSDSEEPLMPRRPASVRIPVRNTRAHGRSLSSPKASPSREERVFDEAFAPNGIQRLSLQDGSRGEKQPINEVSQKATGNSENVPVKTALQAEDYVGIDPPETVLLRELPFTLQGLSSTNLSFSSITSLKLPSTLPPPIISILYTLAEPSLLYKGLIDFVQSSEGGLLGQSLRAAIEGELRSYLGLVATLEGQIRRALSSLNEDEPRGGIGKAGVTLKRCVVWTREATMGLRLLSLLAEESKSKKGGQLISLIHGLSSSHGDPLVGAFAERLLAHVTRPFYDMLRQWIYDGELSDPYHEFFVSEQDPDAVQPNSNGRSRGAASSVWEDKYKIDNNMIPSIITQDFAQKVFLIGKSLNFIRYGCGDSLWVEEYSKEASKELRYGDTETLETWIDEAYKTTMARLIHLMADKFHLFEHLQALKNYILLGQGDFIALLMESLSANLDRPAGAQYRHTLTAQLEHAIRGSNAQYDSVEVLRRLDARMLQLSHGDIGWDCFTLEYKIDAPVDVVVTEWGNRQYLKVFNFLWRIKRVEFVLATTWRNCMTGARGVLQSVDESVAQSWKLTRGVIAEMIHFIGQLQYYILFEVIESSWDELQTAIHKEGCTLDDLIGSHTRYLNAITHKGLLGAKKLRHGEEDENTFMLQLGELLRIMLTYRDAVDGLYSWSVAEFTRRQEASVRAETRQGRYNDGSDDEGNPLPTPATTRRGPKHLAQDSISSTPVPGAIPGLSNLGESDDMFPALRDRLKTLGEQFKTKLSVLLGDLAYQPDVDMRFLGVVMNFNDVYQPVRKSRAKDKAASKEKGK
ncbi:MAG: Microtubule-nucleating Tub4p (gamma-tubulin) complex component [Claussenomyces sp. TS43310]|nr:MAG: Microtubule-nucleating Tub4p (gamma-tubulin) complex component [Claussenomyces sp. TS43310]